MTSVTTNFMGFSAATTLAYLLLGFFHFLPFRGFSGGSRGPLLYSTTPSTRENRVWSLPIPTCTQTHTQICTTHTNQYVGLEQILENNRYCCTAKFSKTGQEERLFLGQLNCLSSSRALQNCMWVADHFSLFTIA